MDIEEFLKEQEIDEQLKKAFQDGFKVGSDYSYKNEMRMKAIRSTLLSFVGYEKEWLITPAAYQKMNKKELIQVIMEQRELLNLLFNSLEHEKKKEIKDKVDLAVWNKTFD